MAQSAPQTSSSPRILIVRPDRIGDVVLSTPVVRALKHQYPTSEITFMVRELAAPLLRGVEGIDHVYVYEPEGRHRGIRGFFRLMEELKAQRFQIAVVLQSTFKIAAALYGIGVANRLGPLSKPHSFFFYNRGTRQRRSLVEMHEADYNLQLLRKLGIRIGTHQIPSQVAVAADQQKWARDWLREKGWDPQPEEHGRLIGIHPGMGGSALNWPEPHYVEIIRALKRDGHEVLVTGGPQEGDLLARIEAELNRTGEKVIFYGGPGAGHVDRLAALFERCAVVVAPSTGPLHVAVAVGRPVVSFYPPIRVQSAIRWGPYVPNEDRASILVPEVYCGEDFKCRGSICNYFPCMKSIGPRQVMEEVNLQLANAIEMEKKAAARVESAAIPSGVPNG